MTTDGGGWTLVVLTNAGLAGHPDVTLEEATTTFSNVNGVLAADLAAQHLIHQREVPVGIITGAVGGPFLLWLLATSGRALGRSGGR